MKHAKSPAEDHRYVAGGMGQQFMDSVRGTNPTVDLQIVCEPEDASMPDRRRA